MFSIISKRRKAQIPVLVFAMIIGAAFEVLGMGLVIQMLNVISGIEHSFFSEINSIIPKLPNEDFMMYGMILFMFIYVVKGIYLAILIWVLGRFTFAVKADIANDLMQKYLNAPYEYHLSRNSAQLIRNLTTEATQFGSSVLNPVLTILTESIVLLAISIFLVAMQPAGALIAIATLSSMSYCFHRLLKSYMRKLGEARRYSDGMVIQKSQEALGGIKDIKVLGVSKNFLKEFQIHNINLSKISAKTYALTQTPRMYLETVGVLTFSVLILILLGQGNKFSDLIPTIAAFMLAAFRLLPSANRVLTALNQLKIADVVIEKLSTELNTKISNKSFDALSKKSDPILTFTKNIEIKNLGYRYRHSDELALNDISFRIHKGESIGIIGESGSGKSTLTDTILGLIPPSQGGIYSDGLDVSQNITYWQSLISYVPQDVFLIDDSIVKNIAFGKAKAEIDRVRLMEAIRDAQLSEFLERLPNGINTNLGERGVRMSGGQKQRIGIARALYRKTPIIVFDEATSALDNKTEEEIVSSIKSLKGQRTTIIVAHRLSTIEHCDRIIEISKGRLVNII